MQILTVPHLSHAWGLVGSATFITCIGTEVYLDDSAVIQYWQWFKVLDCSKFHLLQLINCFSLINFITFVMELNIAIKCPDSLRVPFPSSLLATLLLQVNKVIGKFSYILWVHHAHGFYDRILNCSTRLSKILKVVYIYKLFQIFVDYAGAASGF